MLHTLPDWAIRHNYFHHSNPRNKDRAKDFFEKSHVRPLVAKAFAVLKNAVASETEKIEARGVLSRLYEGRSSANMEAGRAVQTATDMALVPDQQGKTYDMAEATRAGVDQLASYKAKNDDDELRREQYLIELPKVVEHAVKGLREAMAGDNRILGEMQLLDTLPGCALPHNTKPDYANRGDLKTKWSRPSTRAKSGWQAGSLPNTLTGMFDMNNVYQAAGFWALNGHRPPFIVYANASDYRVFTPENAPELRDDYLHDVVADLAMREKTTENILRTARSKHELFSLVSPDWRAMYWNEPVTFIQEAKKFWGSQ